MNKLTFTSLLLFLGIVSTILFGEDYYLHYIGYAFIGYINVMLALYGLSLFLMITRDDMEFKPLKYNSKFNRYLGTAYILGYSTLLYYMGHEIIAYMTFFNIVIFCIISSQAIKKFGVKYEY